MLEIKTKTKQEIDENKNILFQYHLQKKNILTKGQ